MILDQLYPRKINESLADEFMAMAKARGMTPRLRGTPDQERERTQQIMTQRAADREQQSRAAAQGDAGKLAELEAELAAMKEKYQSLGGSNWQYADREQNLTDREREARGMEPALNRLSARVSAAKKASVNESTQSKRRRLNESWLMEDANYRNFKKLGSYIAERRMSEKEILQVFADAEAGMTNKGTGANRTMLGRGKDTAMDFAGGVKDAVTGVLNSIQNSVPVAAVDVAYDQATDAIAGMAGGQKGKVMQAIKGYRNLVKEYPKASGFAKAALVAIAGLATGGAGLPAIAGLTYALDSAIRGDKLSSVLGKGAGAAAVTWGGQQVAGMLGNKAPADDFAAATDAVAGAEGGGTYTVQKGDQLGYIAQANGSTVEQIRAANPTIDFSKPLKPGMEIELPTAGTPGQGSVWQGYQGNMYGDKAAGPELLGGPGAGDVAQTASAPIDYSKPGPISTDSLGQKLEYGIPVNDKGSFIPPSGNLPADELAKQTAAYNTWKADFMKRWPDATQMPDGSMQGIKPGLAPMYPSNYTPGMDTGGLTPKAVQESIKFKTLPADRLIDQKSTVLSWALSESIGRRSRSVNLTTAGTYTVFENVDRYRKAIMEKAGVPGSTRPAFYRPDMPDGPGKPGKPGIIGKGLNWLDKAAGKVGGALSNFGHQFTTGVTKEKLKMNWHQAGKPSDSDQLAAFLAKQGVPQDVVTGVYGKMGIPYTPQAEPAKAAATEPAATPAAAKAGGAQRSMPFYGKNPDTEKPWTYDELQAKATAGAPAVPEPTAEPAAKTTQPTSNLPGFNATNVMNLPGMQGAKKPAPAKTPNFAGPTGYGKTTMSVKPMTGIPGMKAPATPATPKAPTAPKAPGIKYNINLPAGGGAGVKAAAEPGKLSKDEYIKRIGAPAMPESRVFNALKKPIAEMLSMVETKEDVARIKQFVDQTFVKYGAVSESAFAVRNRLIEHVTQVGAQRRREFARKS